MGQGRGFTPQAFPSLALPTRGGNASRPSLIPPCTVSLQTWQRQLEKPVELHSSTISLGNWGREGRGNNAHRGGKEAVSRTHWTWLLFPCQVSDDRGEGNESNKQDQAFCQPGEGTGQLSQGEGYTWLQERR